MAKTKIKAKPKKGKPAAKTVKKKTATKKSVTKKTAVKKSSVKKVAPKKKTSKPAQQKKPVQAAQKQKPMPVAKGKPAAKPVFKKENKKDAKQKPMAPAPPRGVYVPPVEKPKGTPTQLSMALEEVKPVISYKPRITRSRSGNLLYQLEYTIRSSPMILYEFLTTPSGLAQWFADSVDINGHRCTFEWEGNIETATIIDAIEDQYIRYKWEDSDEDEYFEFRISKNEITGDTILTITDFASERDMKDEKLLWDSQVKLLVQQVGG